jgi:hypothetical protein
VVLLVAITLSGFGGLDGGENHEGKRREKEKDDIFLEGESSANRGCDMRQDGLSGQKFRMKVGRCLVALLNLSFTSNLNPLGLER